MNKRNKYNLSILLLFIVITFLLGGCMPFWHLPGWKVVDVTSDKLYWGGFVPGATYELKTDMFKQRKDTFVNSITSYVLTSPCSYKYSRYWESPESVEIYLKDKDMWPDVIKIIPKGARITIIKLELLRPPDNNKQRKGTIAVIGVIDGESESEGKVHLEDLANRDNDGPNGSWVCYPYDYLLEKINDTQK